MPLNLRGDTGGSLEKNLFDNVLAKFSVDMGWFHLYYQRDSSFIGIFLATRWA
jgi:hypothetical protein